MDFHSRLEDLKTVASKLSIEIECRNLKDDEFRFASGFCRVNGKNIVILDKRLPEGEQIAVVIETLRKFDLDGFYMAPWIRERLEKQAP